MAPETGPEADRRLMIARDLHRLGYRAASSSVMRQEMSTEEGLDHARKRIREINSGHEPGTVGRADAERLDRHNRKIQKFLDRYENEGQNEE